MKYFVITFIVRLIFTFGLQFRSHRIRYGEASFAVHNRADQDVIGKILAIIVIFNDFRFREGFRIRFFYTPPTVGPGNQIPFLAGFQIFSSRYVDSQNGGRTLVFRYSSSCLQC